MKIKALYLENVVIRSFVMFFLPYFVSPYWIVLLWSRKRNRDIQSDSVEKRGKWFPPFVQFFVYTLIPFSTCNTLGVTICSNMITSWKGDAHDVSKEFDPI